MRIKVVLEQAKEGGYAVENIKKTAELYIEIGDLMQLINMEDVWMKKS